MPENFERQFDPWAKQENVSSTFDPSQEAENNQSSTAEISPEIVKKDEPEIEKIEPAIPPPIETPTEKERQEPVIEKVEQSQVVAPTEAPIQEDKSQTIETPTEKEEFVPKEALQKIKEAPKEERREKIADFKERLVKQKEALAKIQETMIAKIRENPDVSIEELKTIAQDFAQENDINTEQLNRINEVLDEYFPKRKLLREVREKYPNDRELFKLLYGKYPDGEIEIILNPLILTIRCYDIRDFAFIDNNICVRAGFDTSMSEKRIKESEGLVGVANRACLLPWLEKLIIAEKASGRKSNEEKSKKVFIHEEQHVISGLFEKEPIEKMHITLNEMREKLDKAETEDETARLFIRGFRFERRKKETKTKDELLAYLKEDFNSEKIKDLLKRKEGFYDYFAKYLKPDFINNLVVNLYGEKYRGAIEKGLKQVFETEYHKLIDEGINAFQYLIEYGDYSREQAIAILMQEPLERWAKVTKRILKAKDSIRSRQERQKLAELEKSQVEAIAENKARDAEKIPSPNPPKEDPIYKPDNELEEDLTGF
jgi:hypothetical protein